MRRERERERDLGLWQTPVPLRVLPRLQGFLAPPSTTSEATTPPSRDTSGTSTSPPCIFRERLFDLDLRILGLMRARTFLQRPVDLLRFWYFLQGVLAPPSTTSPPCPPRMRVSLPDALRFQGLRLRLWLPLRFLQWPVALLRFWYFLHLFKPPSSSTMSDIYFIIL